MGNRHERQEATDGHDDVDPQIREFLTRMAAGYAQHPELAGAALPEARRIVAQVRAQWVQGGPEMAAVSEIEVGTLRTRARILAPTTGAPLPALLYLHGGGWTMFSIDTHDRLMREYAARAGVAVIALDYSLSPEAKYPRALDETVDALAWLQGHGHAHGIDPGRIAIGGDSAGANLSVASQLRARDEGLRPAAGMLLSYGVYSDRPSPSWARYDGPDYMLEAVEMQRFWDNYLSSTAERSNPLVMPLLADLHHLPAAHMSIAECDILADGNLAMATALRNAGNTVDMHVYPGATHSFLEAMSISDLANRAIDNAARWLHDTLVHA